MNMAAYPAQDTCGVRSSAGAATFLWYARFATLSLATVFLIAPGTTVGDEPISSFRDSVTLRTSATHVVIHMYDTQTLCFVCGNTQTVSL